MVDVGDATKVSWAWGTPAETVALTVTAPDGTTSTPTVTEPTTGNYEATLTAALAGRYTLRWTATGGSHSDILNVWPADPRYIISFDEAVAALRWRPVEVEKRSEDLRLHCASVTEILEDIVGAIILRTVTQTADGGTAGVVLTGRVDGIVEVKVDGVAVTDYVPDLSASIVWASRYPDVTFPEGRQIIEVTYTTGASSVSPSIRDAARILIRHMVAVEQGPSPAVDDGGELGRTPTGFMVPKRVLELVANRRPLPGIA